MPGQNSKVKTLLQPWVVKVRLCTGRWLRIPVWKVLASTGIVPSVKHRLRIFSQKGRQFFFGYYDVTPFSREERLLLACSAPLQYRTPHPDDVLKIGYFDLASDASEFREIGNTTTWCWQQGCRLQWYPSTSDTRIIYNRLVGGSYGCVIQCLQTSAVEKEYERPVYSVSSNGKWGLTLNFSRLHRLRPGYGYVNLPDETQGQLCPEQDGIWRVDLEAGNAELLFSVAQIANFAPLPGMDGAEHYFNHILFNPSGSRFMFFHLWIKEGKRYIRMLTCDSNGCNLYPLANEGHVSHYTWKNDQELLAFSTHSTTGTRFHLYKDQTDERSAVGEDILMQDGHPSYFPDGKHVLVDTYPNKYGEQRLLIYDCNAQISNTLQALHCPLPFRKEVRCDLHPRMSPSGRYVCIDSAQAGARAMYVLDLRLSEPQNPNPV